MTRRRALQLAVAGVGGLVVIVLVLGVITAITAVRRPYPMREGEVVLNGLRATVTVVRDERGVPQIYADNAADLFRAQGYVHAQDRFLEMDIRRRVTAGRLAELLGANQSALRADILSRTLGWRRVAAEELNLASPETRAALEAYSAGVNDYLRDRSADRLSVGYRLLGLSHDLPPIEPWTPVDSLAWLKAVSWDLKANYQDELDRARAFATVGSVERVEQLFPDFAADERAPIVADSELPGANASPAPPPAAPAAGEEEARLLGAGLLRSFVSPSAREALDAAQAALDAVPGASAAIGDLGSNAWAVSGELTKSGKPMLASDPHLAPAIPGPWYQVGLHCTTEGASCPYRVAGFSMAGLPGVLVGHNDTVAWGISSLHADVTDFFLEREADGGRRYERDGRDVPFDVRTEVIEVADRDPVRIQIRSTVHGPVISDVVDSLTGMRASLGLEGLAALHEMPEDSTAGGESGDGGESGEGNEGNGGNGGAGRADPEAASYAVSLAWTALEPSRTMDGVLGINRSGGLGSFRQAARYLASPAQSLVYADVEGNIGYQAAGVIPVRRGNAPDGQAGPGAMLAVPADGTWPQPGWNSDYDWHGRVPFTDLPTVQNPVSGYVIAANQAPTSGRFGSRLPGDWDPGYRAERIRALIEDARDDGRRITAEVFGAMQADTRNGIAAELLPLLQRVKVDAFTREAVALLKGWDKYQTADSPSAAYFNAVWANILELTFDDELPQGARAAGGGRWFEVVRTLLDQPRDPWWDDRRTPGVVEARDEILRQALVQARLDLTRTLGKDPERWSWGRLHRLRLRHPVLGGSDASWPARQLFDRDPLEVPGSTAAISAFSWNAASGTFDVTTTPSMRMIVDLGDFDASRWVNMTGQSAHPGDDRYDDQLDAWLEGRHYPWPFSRDAVEEARENELVLSPISED